MLLNEAQNISVVALYPWLLLPVIPVILTVLAFNFLGDGLRDAADPYHDRFPRQSSLRKQEPTANLSVAVTVDLAFAGRTTTFGLSGAVCAAASERS